MEIGLKILETQEMERKRIARDLHDSTIQALTNLLHKTELCQKLLDNDKERTKSELISMNESVKSIINEMRSIIYNLQPMSLTDLGLAATIERFIDSINIENNKQIVFRVHGEKRSINSLISLSAYRIVQEACNNAIKHSEANSVVVHLAYLDDYIEIRIEDDGKGFNKDEKKKLAEKEKHGYGLPIMQERVSLLNGELFINSVNEKGTKILVRIPTKE